MTYFRDRKKKIIETLYRILVSIVLYQYSYIYEADHVLLCLLPLSHLNCSISYVVHHWIQYTQMKHKFDGLAIWPRYKFLIELVKAAGGAEDRFNTGRQTIMQKRKHLEFGSISLCTPKRARSLRNKLANTIQVTTIFIKASPHIFISSTRSLFINIESSSHLAVHIHVFRIFTHFTPHLLQ